MAIPTITPEELELLEKERTKLITIRDGLIEAKATKEAKIIEMTELDSVFSKFWLYFNDTIVNNYDREWQNLNGRYFPGYYEPTEDPNVSIWIPEGNIVEHDLEMAARANRHGRLTPNMPDTDLIRIPQFDGGLTGTTPNNELDNSTATTELLDIFRNGVSGTVNTAVTTSSLTPTSTSCTFSQTPAVTLQVGETYVIQSGANVAIIKILNVRDVFPVGPTYTGTLDIEYIMAPTSTLGSGQAFATFSGFSNSDRISKTTSNQNLMDAMLAQLNSLVEAWEDNITSQITHLSNNEDEFQQPEILSALSNANAAFSFVNAYHASLDISNSGISSVSGFIATRTPQIAARVAQISAAYTGGGINYYDERYKYANIRANTAGGSLRSLRVAEDTLSTLDDMIADAQAAVDAIDGVLP